MYESVNTNLSLRNALQYVGLLGDLSKESLSTDTLPGSPKMIGGVSYVVPDTKALSDIVLTEFGYPE